MEISTGEWPWLITHLGHDAWYQRALLTGDFAPGKAPVSNYALTLDGALPDPEAPMTCGTCGQTPSASDLNATDRATGKAEFLAAFRGGQARWLKGTDPATCAYCNDSARLTGHPLRPVKLAKIAARHGKPHRGPDRDVLVCPSCASHLAGKE